MTESGGETKGRFSYRPFRMIYESSQLSVAYKGIIADNHQEGGDNGRKKAHQYSVR